MITLDIYCKEAIKVDKMYCIAYIFVEVRGYIFVDDRGYIFVEDRGYIFQQVMGGSPVRTKTFSGSSVKEFSMTTPVNYTLTLYIYIRQTRGFQNVHPLSLIPSLLSVYLSIFCDVHYHTPSSLPLVCISQHLL